MKWRPAVGAAAEPGGSAYTVWYRSSGASRAVMYGGSGISPTSSMSSIGSRVNVTARVPSPTASPDGQGVAVRELDRRARSQPPPGPDECLPSGLGISVGAAGSRSLPHRSAVRGAVPAARGCR